MVLMEEEDSALPRGGSGPCRGRGPTQQIIGHVSDGSLVSQDFLMGTSYRRFSYRRWYLPNRLALEIEGV